MRHFADPAGILTVEGCGEFDGADCSRVAISATVQRRWGSRRKQQWAIPMNGAGTVSGKGSAIPSQAGKRWVSASITVIPSDQASDAGKDLAVRDLGRVVRAGRSEEACRLAGPKQAVA